MFVRAHHQRIHEILLALDAQFLRAHQCYFGGGTAIVLQHDEYRESVDIDFLICDVDCYRAMRIAMRDEVNLTKFFGLDRGVITEVPEIRADQYGIRAKLPINAQSVKFEIVFEARITFDAPNVSDQVAGVTTLTRTDLVASKLLANVDRWLDSSVMSRDIIDLAMIEASNEDWARAMGKADQAYGPVVKDSLQQAKSQLLNDPLRLSRCMEALQINIPQAMLHNRLACLP